jgi:DNA-binding NarL/FixJ family response regulator
VLVVDDHPVVLTGLAALLADEPWVDRVETATTAEEGVRRAREHPPLLAVLDLRLPDASGVDLLRRLVALVPDVRAVILTMHADEEAALRAVASGAVGYLLKDTPPDDMRLALASAARGGLVIDPAVASPVRRSLGGGGRPLPELTPRQHELLDLVAAGLPTAVVAARMHLTPKTVRNRLSEVFQALGVSSRAEAIVRAREAGLGRGERG